jgi:hypothetical protein
MYPTLWQFWKKRSKELQDLISCLAAKFLAPKLQFFFINLEKQLEVDK